MAPAVSSQKAEMEINQGSSQNANCDKKLEAYVGNLGKRESPEYESQKKPKRPDRKEAKNLWQNSYDEIGP